MNRVVSVLAMGCVVVLGCRGQAPQEPAGEQATKSDVRCPDELTVDAGTRQTPEGTLWLAYKAALGPDDDAGFAAFRDLWQPEADTGHIRTQIWPRVREHVGKYVADPAAPTFTRCRRLDAPGGRVKVFVRSSAPQKSDPPSILTQVEGAWVIDVMTP